MQDEARPGDYLVCCDFSGFKCWASETVMTWDNRRVLRRFVGEEVQRHPQDRIRVVADRPAVRNPRPEGTDVFVTVQITPADL